MDTGNDEPSPAAKRQKIAVACDSCRKRKIRCDGKAPVCTQCVSGRKRHTCTYEGKTPDRRSRFQRDMENHFACYDALPNTEESADNAATAGGRTGQDVTPVANIGPSRSPLALAEHQNVVLGESSSTTFLNRLSRHQEDHQQDFVSGATNTVPFKPLGSSVEKAGVLPRRRIADAIVDCYWKFVHPLFPILHAPTFMTVYEKSWAPQPNIVTQLDQGRREFEEALFYSTLNIIFALGTRFCDSIPAAEKSSMTREFYCRSRQTFAYDILDCTSLPVLQLVLLHGVYLQSTTEISRCWNMIGVGIRMAQSLGLHSEQLYQRQKTKYAREMGRRLWHSCLVLDRLAAATSGWPIMIQSEHNISLPVLGDDALSPEGQAFSGPVGSLSDLSIFRYTCELFSVVGDILTTLYCNNGALLPASTDTRWQSQILSQIMALNGRLEAYRITLPEHIRGFIEGREETVSQNTLPPKPLYQQAISCRYLRWRYGVRYLYTQILLLRPVLLLPLDYPDVIEEGFIPPDEKLIMHAINLCATACYRLIEILHSNLSSPFRVADWHVVYMTFTAATSLLGNKRSAPVQARHLHERIDNKMKDSRQILRYMNLGSNVSVASQALHSLDALEDEIVQEMTTRCRNLAMSHVLTSVEQDAGNTLENLEDVDGFDWLANPSALLSMQTPGLDMSWLAGADSWLS
ncbi:hypothetical protein E4T51_14367 [Aureobasidium sp. EXF-12344]|nr:hypothetical protein E4T51_14367 [Aureobasidium sp. EXF-12344]